MLQDLKVLNGELSLKFDPLQTKYSVTVTDAKNLEFSYVVSDGVTVVIKNNDLSTSNEVNFIVKKDNKEDIYTFYILREEPVINVNDTYKFIEGEIKEELPIYVAPLIGSSIFLILLILFCLFFHKKGKKLNLKKLEKKI